jgi:hypothetical protein
MDKPRSTRQQGQCDENKKSKRHRDNEVGLSIDHNANKSKRIKIVMAKSPKEVAVQGILKPANAFHYRNNDVFSSHWVAADSPSSSGNVASTSAASIFKPRNQTAVGIASGSSGAVRVERLKTSIRSPCASSTKKRVSFTDPLEIPSSSREVNVKIEDDEDHPMIGDLKENIEAESNQPLSFGIQQLKNASLVQSPRQKELQTLVVKPSNVRKLKEFKQKMAMAPQGTKQDKQTIQPDKNIEQSTSQIDLLAREVESGKVAIAGLKKELLKVRKEISDAKMKYEQKEQELHVFRQGLSKEGGLMVLNVVFTVCSL